MAPSSHFKATPRTELPNTKAIGRSSLRLRPPDVQPVTSNSRETPSALTSALYDDLVRHRGDVVRYLSWLGVPQPAIDELTQDVLLVAHRRRTEFRGESSIKTWLSGIAFHLVLNWRRRRKWREHWEQTGMPDKTSFEPEGTATTRNAMDELLTKELCFSVAQVLNDQPEAARSLWLMVVLEEFAISCAAKALGISEYQAQQAFAKTQQRVRQALLREERIRVRGRTGNQTPTAP